MSRLKTPAPVSDNQTPRLQLPGVGKGRGMRVFVRLLDDRMTAYQAPVVEAVPLSHADWEHLDHPQVERVISASLLKKWLAQVYPPGVMERTDPKTKEVYRIKTVSGDLTLVSAGDNDKERFATLTGQVQLTDEGDFSHQGRLRLFLTYPLSDATATGIAGVFEGVYPRSDPIRNVTRELPLQAVFESTP